MGTYLFSILYFDRNCYLLPFYPTNFIAVASGCLFCLHAQVKEAQKRLNKWEDKKTEPIEASIGNDK